MIKTRTTTYPLQQYQKSKKFFIEVFYNEKLFTTIILPAKLKTGSFIDFIDDDHEANNSEQAEIDNILLRNVYVTG
jgi:hypothetical protein